jgi:D-arabinose 1-dehydrogenase-like Zn-dependent alcohol dehydrogenase
LPILARGAKVFPLTISTEALQLSPLSLIMGSLRVIGTSLAPIASVRAMLEFAAKHGIKPEIESFPLDLAGVNTAMKKLRNGEMRYRGVLVAA